MSAVKRLNELRAKAHQAQQAVLAEEDRLRQEYNDALTGLHDQVEAVLDEAKWTVALRDQRMGASSILARPGWASKDTLRVTFAFAYEDAPNAFEDRLNSAVMLTDLGSGETVRFSGAPHADALLALVKVYMELMSPPDR